MKRVLTMAAALVLVMIALVSSASADTVMYVRTGNGKTLTVIAKNFSKENKYVKSVTFNGKPLDKTIEHADLMAGGELVFEMTAK